MSTLQSVYMMAFTPEKMDNNTLMAVCQMAADRLCAKDATFAQRMSMLGPQSQLKLANQLHMPTMHTPQSMQSTLDAWLANEKTSFAPRIGDNFFPFGIRDPQGRENYILFYFDLK